MTSPLSALTATWNAIGTTFTAIKMTVTDTASAANSRLLALIVGVTDKFVVEKDGSSYQAGLIVTAPNGVVGTRTVNNDNINYGDFPAAIPMLGVAVVAGGNTTIYELIGAANGGAGESGDFIPYCSQISISDIITNDIGFYAPVDNLINNVGFDIHIAIGTSVCVPYPGKMGSIEWDDGSAHHMNITFVPDLGLFQFGRNWSPTNNITSGNDCSSLVRFGVLTVAALPSAATVGVGTRAFVTDALTPTFGATVAGSGAVAIPVYSDGTNWRVG